MLGLDLGQGVPATRLRVYVEDRDPAESAGAHADVRVGVALPDRLDLGGVASRVVQAVGSDRNLAAGLEWQDPPAMLAVVQSRGRQVGRRSGQT